MAWASKSYTFAPSTVIASAEVNQNFDDLVAGLNTAMPSGGIIMWSGSIASVPTGWYLCDGNNGTPNLTNRFVVCAGGSYSVGSTGGASTHSMIEAELATHTHVQNAHTHVQDAHTHTQNSHNHGGSTGTVEGSIEKDVSGSGSSRNNYRTGTYHSHTIPSDTATNQNTTATNQNATATNQNTGSGQAFSILPPYYALAYIMKS